MLHVMLLYFCPPTSVRCVIYFILPYNGSTQFEPIEKESVRREGDEKCILNRWMHSCNPINTLTIKINSMVWRW